MSVVGGCKLTITVDTHGAGRVKLLLRHRNGECPDAGTTNKSVSPVQVEASTSSAFRARVEAHAAKVLAEAVSPAGRKAAAERKAARELKKSERAGGGGDGAGGGGASGGGASAGARS